MNYNYEHNCRTAHKADIPSTVSIVCNSDQVHSPTAVAIPDLPCGCIMERIKCIRIMNEIS